MNAPVLLSRRRMVQVGTAGYLGLSLPQVLWADQSLAARTKQRSADACILIFLNGGPSHLDMWDMKPNAPAEIRGEFKPIATSVTGIQLSEHLPRLAQRIHHGAIIRSVHHSVHHSDAASGYA